MGIFDSTFRQHIKDELNSRKSSRGRQQVYHPTARVTALVEGNLSGQQLKGFTLGPQDVTTVNKLDQLTNISGNGVVVGTTYVGGNPEPVRIKTKKNLPSPGVTNISISTQSKGGLVFKATVNLKFYGKEQYDFIYQTFMRPGNPILIEYGHTQDRMGRSDRTKKALNDLKFFKDLTDVTPYANDIKQVSKLPAGRNYGKVTGLVSNFKISLNEENEYEASIDIINALEFLYTLSPENTLMSYKDTSLADSIKNNFGYQSDDEYNPEYDRIYQMVANDNKIPSYNNDEPSVPRLPNYMKHILSPNEVTKFVTNETSLEGEQIEVMALEEPNAMLNADHTWVSLNYVLIRLLPYILRQSIICKDGSYQTLVGTAAQIKDLSKGRDFVSNIIAGGSRRRRLREASQQVFDDLAPNEQFAFLFEPIGKHTILRSSNVQELIVNNNTLYDRGDLASDNSTVAVIRSKSGERVEMNQIQSVRINDYVKAFDLPVTETRELSNEEGEADRLLKLFKTINMWGPRNKETYGKPIVNDPDSGETLGTELTLNKGLFLNYHMVRNAFINSSSVSEAITRLLNVINTNTSGILKLKMRQIPIDKGTEESSSEVFKLVIYDENTLPAKEDDIPEIYKFFENDTSEAISYNFDFSLPQTVAATVLANNFDGPPDSVVGEAELDQLVRNGYNKNIKSMINTVKSQNQDDGCREERMARPLNLWVSDPSRRSYDTNDVSLLEIYGVEADQLKQFQDAINEFYTQIVGYQELFPPQMKSETIRRGLFDTLPTSARVSIKLIGVDGFRFADMFSVRKVLPAPYDENNIFMLTGYKHDVSSEGWTTTIDGIMIASSPVEKRPLRPGDFIDIDGNVISQAELVQSTQGDQGTR